MGLLFTVFLSVAQIINRASLNGIFYYLGERSFTASTYGISLMRVFDNVYLRPYSTFPHPNVLAGYTLIALLIIMATAQSKLLKVLSLIVSSFLLIISFSQNAWAVAMLMLIIKSTKLKVSYLYWLVVFMFCMSIFISVASFNILKIEEIGSLEFLEKRLHLMDIGFQLIKENFWFGIGNGNFIHWLPSYRYYFLQPIHSVYLQLFVEVGVLVILPLLYFAKQLFLDFKIENSYLLMAWAAVLTLSFSDHYFLTIHQTQSLMTLLIALSLAHGKNNRAL